MLMLVKMPSHEHAAPVHATNTLLTADSLEGRAKNKASENGSERERERARKAGMMVPSAKHMALHTRLARPLCLYGHRPRAIVSII